MWLLRHNFPKRHIGRIHSAATLCAATEDDVTVNIYNFPKLNPAAGKNSAK